MSMLNGMSLDDIQTQVIRRNIAIDSLKTAKKAIRQGKTEIDGMRPDDCHIATSSYHVHRFGFLLEEINRLITSLEKGDWCFSIECTKESEEQME